jgi:hypothetical protein
MSLEQSISHLCVSNRSKHHGLPLYVHPHKAAGYIGTENATNNQNYRVVVKINKKVETITYARSIETANEVAKAVKVMQKLYKAELQAKSLEIKELKKLTK